MGVRLRSGPPTPDWQTNARSSMDRAVATYLAGDTRARRPNWTARAVRSPAPGALTCSRVLN